MWTQDAQGNSTSFLNGVMLPFVGKAKWFDGPAAVPITLCGVVVDESLGFTTEWLTEQADYTKRLLGCATLTDVMQCQWEFVNRAWARSASQASRLSDSLRANVVAGPAA